MSGVMSAARELRAAVEARAESLTLHPATGDLDTEEGRAHWSAVSTRYEAAIAAVVEAVVLADAGPSYANEDDKVDALRSAFRSAFTIPAPGMSSCVTAIVDGIEADLNDRRGLHLDSLDDDTVESIKGAWRTIVVNVLGPRAAYARSTPPAAVVLLRTLVDEVEKVAAPISSRDAVDYTDRYAEHHRAIGAVATIAGMIGRELGAPDLHARALAAIGIKVPA